MADAGCHAEMMFAADPLPWHGLAGKRFEVPLEDEGLDLYSTFFASEEHDCAMHNVIDFVARRGRAFDVRWTFTTELSEQAVTVEATFTLTRFVVRDASVKTESAAREALAAICDADDLGEFGKEGDDMLFDLRDTD